MSAMDTSQPAVVASEEGDALAKAELFLASYMQDKRVRDLCEIVSAEFVSLPKSLVDRYASKRADLKRRLRKTHLHKDYFGFLCVCGELAVPLTSAGGDATAPVGSISLADLPARVKEGSLTVHDVPFELLGPRAHGLHLVSHTDLAIAGALLDLVAAKWSERPALDKWAGVAAEFDLLMFKYLRGNQSHLAVIDDLPNGTIACSRYVKSDYDAIGCMGTVRGAQRSQSLFEKLSKSFVYVYESDIKMPLAGLPAGVLAHALVKLRVADVKVMLELLTEMGLIAGALDAFLAQLPASRTSLHYYAQHHQSAFACTHCQHESIADADQTSNGDASASSTATAAAAPNPETEDRLKRMIEQINNKSAVPAKRARLPTPGSAGRGFGAGARGMGRGAGALGIGARGRPNWRGARGMTFRGQWPRVPGGGPMPPQLAMRARGAGPSPMMKQRGMPPWLMARGRAARGGGVGVGGPRQMAAMRQQQMMAAAMQQQMAAAAAAYNYGGEYDGEEEYEEGDDEYADYSYDGDDGSYDWSGFDNPNPYNMFMAQQNMQNMMPPAGIQFWQPPVTASRPIRRPLRGFGGRMMPPRGRSARGSSRSRK